MEELKKYHFVKIREKRNPDSKGTWYLEADSLSTIHEHFLKYVGAEIKEGVQQIVSRASDMIGHYTNRFAMTVDVMMQLNEGKSCITVATELENEMLQTRIKNYVNGTEQYLTDSLSVLLFSPNLEIIDEQYKSEMIYPHETKPSLEDVKFMTWHGGKHWYAKIGKMDVVDRDNNQKWDTKKEAEEAAKWYIENYY